MLSFTFATPAKAQTAETKHGQHFPDTGNDILCLLSGRVPYRFSGDDYTLDYGNSDAQVGMIRIYSKKNGKRLIATFINMPCFQFTGDR